MAQGDGKKLKAQMGQKPRPTITDEQWAAFKAMSPAEKSVALHNHDAYYVAVRRRWMAETGLGDGVWQRQLNNWNARLDQDLAARGL